MWAFDAQYQLQILTFLILVIHRRYQLRSMLVGGSNALQVKQQLQDIYQDERYADHNEVESDYHKVSLLKSDKPQIYRDSTYQKINAYYTQVNVTIRMEPSWSDDDYSICANSGAIHICSPCMLHIRYQEHNIYQMSVLKQKLLFIQTYMNHVGYS